MSLIPRTLGRRDLVLLKVVAIVNINNVPPVAVHGWATLMLWALAFVTFFVPEAIAVVTPARRYPGEGGIYLWTEGNSPTRTVSLRLVLLDQQPGLRAGPPRLPGRHLRVCRRRCRRRRS